MSYLLFVAAGFLIALAFAKYRESAWTSAVLQGVFGAVVGFGMNGIITAFRTDCCSYVFNSDDKLGWYVPLTDSDRASRGGAFVTRRFSTEQGHGDGALEVAADLRGGTKNETPPMDRGEVFVLLQQFPPLGGRVGVSPSLWLSRVEVIVDVPRSLVSQETHTASFVQLYFETCPPLSERFDGEPGEQILGDGPITVSYRWWTRKASRACRLGIKIGLNDADRGSYQGRVFITGVRWTPFSWYLGRLLAVALLIGGVALHFWVDREIKRRASRLPPPL